MAFSTDFLLASSALTTMVGLVVLVIGVAKIRRGPSEGIILAVIGAVLVITGFLASRYAE